MIEVILLEKIERLGTMGDKVKVRPGFARNYLLPQNKALRATKSNIEYFEAQKADLEAKNIAKRTEAEKLAETMKDLKVIIIRQASEMGILYGSVTARDIATAAKEDGITIDKLMVQIDTPIKTLGLFTVKVKLHPEVIINITINVARSKEEANAQLQKGMDLKKAAEKEAKADAERAVIDAIGTPSPEAQIAMEEKAKKEDKKEEEAK